MREEGAGRRSRREEQEGGEKWGGMGFT